MRSHAARASVSNAPGDRRPMRRRSAKRTCSRSRGGRTLARSLFAPAARAGGRRRLGRGLGLRGRAAGAVAARRLVAPIALTLAVTTTPLAVTPPAALLPAARDLRAHGALTLGAGALLRTRHRCEQGTRRRIEVALEPGELPLLPVAAPHRFGPQGQPLGLG